MPLKYDNFRFDWPVVSEKTFNIVYVKVSYLSAGILNDKSAFSPVIDILKKIRLIPMNS